LIVVISALLAVILFYPSIDSQASKTTTASIEMQQSPGRNGVVIAGFMLGVVRFFIAGSVEASTSLLLETKFGWGIASTGLITGLAFLTGLPVWMAYNRIGKHMNRIMFVRMLASIAALGTVLLFKAPSKLLPKGLTLVFGDVIIFPPLYIVLGLTQGMMMQHVPSENDSLFLNPTMLGMAYDMVGSACYGIGAVQSRWVIEVGGLWGQDVYASIVLSCCILFFAIFEMGIGRQQPGLEASNPICVATSPPAEASCDQSG